MRNALVRTAVAIGPSSRGRHRRATPLDTRRIYAARSLAATLTLGSVVAVVLGVWVGAT